MGARQILKDSFEKMPGLSEILELTQTSQSQAFEMLARLKEAATHLPKKPGPKAREGLDSQGDIVELFRATRDFLMDTPGVVSGGPLRRQYHESFRGFVLAQRVEGKPGARLSVEQVADTVGVPLGTLKNWISPPLPTETTPASSGPASTDGSTESSGRIPSFEVADPLLATLFREFSLWKGRFGDFCRHLWDHHRFPYKRTFISTLLEMAGLRTPQRKKTVNARPWSRGTFQRLFPGAQWVGDGKALVIQWNQESMAFNIEAIIDPASDALVGVTITDTENEQAVLEAYRQAQQTAGHAPLALTLDNRGSNHTERIKAEISPAELLASTLYSATSKAPIEGAFGLFSQVAPPLIVQGKTPREHARAVLNLIVCIWAWSRNHKPRRRFGNRSPAQVYQNALPSTEDIQKAKEFIQSLKQRQEEMRRSREAKLDPVRRQLLRENLTELGIPNAENLSLQLAIYSQEAILRGLAVFRTKKKQNTLPCGVDQGRYLGGILRNIHQQLEDEAVAFELLALRLRSRELSIESLNQQIEQLTQTVSPYALPQRLVENALEAKPLVDFRFWRDQAVATLTSLPDRLARSIYFALVRRISRSHATPRDRRTDLVASLSAFATLAVG
jgi:hypothetical protein